VWTSGLVCSFAFGIGAFSESETSIFPGLARMLAGSFFGHLIVWLLLCKKLTDLKLSRFAVATLLIISSIGAWLIWPIYILYDLLTEEPAQGLEPLVLPLLMFVLIPIGIQLLLSKNFKIQTSNRKLPTSKES
jgi:hypothetical protein